MPQQQLVEIAWALGAEAGPTMGVSPPRSEEDTQNLFG